MSGTIHIKFKRLVNDHSDIQIQINCFLICVFSPTHCEFKAMVFCFNNSKKVTHCPFQEFVVSISGAFCIFFPFHKL